MKEREKRIVPVEKGCFGIRRSGRYPPASGPTRALVSSSSTGRDGTYLLDRYLQSLA